MSLNPDPESQDTLTSAGDSACPVILMSGYSEDEAVQRLATRGIARFLQKPFAMKELTAKLVEALTGSGA